MPTPSIRHEIPSDWASVNGKGEPTVICPPPSHPAKHSLATTASSSMPSSSTVMPPIQNQYYPQTPNKKKKKENTTGVSQPVTPTNPAPSPGTTSDGSLPSLSNISFKRPPKPKHCIQTTDQSPTFIRPVLAEMEVNIQRGTPKCVRETPQKLAQQRPKTNATESPHFLGNTTDNHITATNNSKEPASNSKAVERREQPVREVKLIASVEQTPRRGKSSHTKSKLGDVQCAKDHSDRDKKEASIRHQLPSRLGSSTEDVGRAESVVEPTSTGPDIVELSETLSPQRCDARAASLDLGDPSSSPSPKPRASMERETSPFAVNVTGAVYPRNVVDEIKIEEEPVVPAKRPCIIARTHSPSPPIILPLTETYQSRKQKIKLIKQADCDRVQCDLEEHDIREVGEARFLISSYETERQKQDKYERDSRMAIKAGKTRLRNLENRMKQAKAKEHRVRGQRFKPKKHKVQQQMSADVTQADHIQTAGLHSRPLHQSMHSHNSQEKRLLPGLPADNQITNASVRPIEPGTKEHRSSRKTPEFSIDTAGGRVRKRAATVGACSSSPEAQNRDHRPKLQSKQRRSNSAAIHEGVHETSGSSVKYTTKSGEVTRDLESLRDAAKRSKSSPHRKPAQSSQVRHKDSEGTVGTCKASEPLKTSEVAMSVKPTADARERPSSGQGASQGISSRPEQRPKMPKPARAKSSKSDTKGPSTTKPNLRLENAVQNSGRDMQQRLQESAEMAESTVAHTFQSNIEVRALVRSYSLHDGMASPVAPPPSSHPSNARHLMFATIPELRKREVDIPLPRCTCQYLSAYFTEQQQRLPSRYNFYRLYFGGPLEFFIMISQIKDCQGHNDCVRDHCRSLWKSEAARPDTWCTFPPERDFSKYETSRAVPKNASTTLSLPKHRNRTGAERRALEDCRNKVVTSAVNGQPTPPTSSPPSFKKRKKTHAKSREAEADTEVSPQANQSDDMISSSPLEKRRKHHTNSDAAPESSSRKQHEGKALAEPSKAKPKGKKRRHQSVSNEDHHDEPPPVVTPFVSTSKSTCSGTKHKSASDREPQPVPPISADSSLTAFSSSGKACERFIEDVHGNTPDESPPQSRAAGCSIKEPSGKRPCLAENTARHATANASPLPNTSNDTYSENDWRPFPGYSDDDMPANTLTTPPPSDNLTNKPSCPGIDTPAPARFASVPASRTLGRATRAVMNIPAKPQSPPLLPNTRSEDLSLTWKQQLEERVAAEIEKRASEAIEKALARHAVAGPGPRTTAARKRSRTQMEGDNDDAEYWTKLYPLHTRLSNEKLCSIARNINLGPQKRHEAAPYAFDPKNGQFRAEYEDLFRQVRFETSQAARRFLRTY